MKKIWRSLGKITFWFSRPFWFIYLMIGKRTRVLVIFEDELLVVRGWLGTGKWGLPGGGIHKGEDSIDGAIRELREETSVNLQPIQLKYLGSATSNYSGLRFHYDQYVAVLNERPIIKPRRTEIVEATWIPLNAINENNAEDTTINTLELWNKSG